MDLGSIFLILGLAVLVALFIFRPFVEISEKKALVDASVPVSEDDQKRSILLAERDRVLRSIQELDFDNTLGKIPEEDFPLQRSNLLARASRIFKALEEMDGVEPAEDHAEKVEAVIAERRSDGKKNRSQKELDIEAMITARKRETKKKTAGFCH